MTFDKETTFRLYRIFRDALEKIREEFDWNYTESGCYTASSKTAVRKHLDSIWGQFGISLVQSNEIAGDGNRFEDTVILKVYEQSAWLPGLGYIIVPRDIAQKILVLGHLPVL